MIRRVPNLGYSQFRRQANFVRSGGACDRPARCGLNRAAYFACIGLCVLTSFFGATLGLAQDDQKISPDSAGPKYVAHSESIWEFGLRIEATGKTTGITATCPIPVDWPEQTVEIIERLKSPAVSRIDFDDLPQNARQFVIKVNGLGAGQLAEATVRVKVIKMAVVAPDAPERFVFAKNLSGKLRPYLQPSPYIETSDSVVRDFAKQIVVDSQLSAWRQIESIYDAVREKIPYEFDAQIRTCPEAIQRGRGDCEELSSLFIAVCRIKQIPARAVWIPDHTYPEFYLEDSDGTGYWFPCQLAGSRQFGEMSEHRPILQKGDKFRAPGNAHPTRYLQPTLVAKDAESNPILTWISREIGNGTNVDSGK